MKKRAHRQPGFPAAALAASAGMGAADAGGRMFLAQIPRAMAGRVTATDDRPAVTEALRGMFTRDFVYLVVSALQVILASSATPILTRLVGEDQFGQFALAVMAMQILGPIFSFGLPFASQKIYAEENGDRRAPAASWLSPPSLPSPPGSSWSSPRRGGVRP